MDPGNASSVPVPIRFLRRLVTNAMPTAYPGPRNTPPSMLMKCWTGAHFDAPTGIDNGEQTIPTATRMPARAQVCQPTGRGVRPRERRCACGLAKVHHRGLATGRDGPCAQPAYRAALSSRLYTVVYSPDSWVNFWDALWSSGGSTVNFIPKDSFFVYSIMPLGTIFK